jgi:16S rRNA processing protein RimM
LSDLPEAKQDWVQVAHILRYRGNKGEVAAELQTDFPERFAALKEVYLRKGSADPKPVALQKFWIDRNHPRIGIFHFSDSKTISDAEKWRGYDVLLPFEQRAEPATGQYFVTDLIGCTVFEIPAGEAVLCSPPSDGEQLPVVLGTVSDVLFPGDGSPGTSLLEIQTPSGELLVPLAEDLCPRIDVAGRRIDVRLPEGLKDLNRQG